MPLFERSKEEILDGMITELSTDSKLNRLSPGSKTRVLLNTVSTHTNQAYKLFDLNLARGFLSGASGKYLDFIGEALGMPRLGFESANASASAKIVKFYVETGTFGDINNGLPITISQGKIISSKQGNTGAVYRVVNGAVLGTSLSEQFVSVEAVSPGEGSRVGREGLVFHNVTEYADKDNASLLITNLSPILNGSNTETNINYKFRLSRATIAGEAGNQTAIMLAALSTPGVANVIMQNRARGVGTFRMLIKSVTPSVSTDLIDNVQQSVQSVTSMGIKDFIDRPFETGFSTALTVTYESGVSDEEKNAIESQIELAIADYVNNLDIQDLFLVGELTDRVLSVSPNIKNIGKANKPFDEIYLYKESTLKDNKIREELLTDYQSGAEERVIIEPSLPDPITISRAN